MDKYRQVGGQLGHYIRANAPRTQQIQGFLSDLLIDDDLLMPMRDAVSRPTFLGLHELIGSGKGSLQRDALLQDLNRSYLPVVVAQIRVLLNGMLAIEETPHVSKAEPLRKWMWAPLTALAVLTAIAVLYRLLPSVQLDLQAISLPYSLKPKKWKPDNSAGEAPEQISKTAPLPEARLPEKVQDRNSQPTISEMTEAEQVSYLVKRCEAAMAAISRLERERPDILTDPAYNIQLSELWSYARSVYPGRPLELKDITHLMHDFPLVKRDYSLSVQIAKKSHLDVLSPFLKREVDMGCYSHKVNAFLAHCDYEVAAGIVSSWRRNLMRPVKGFM